MRSKCSLVLALTLLVATGFASAAETQAYWTGAGGDGLWGTAANWWDPVSSTSYVPDINTHAIFDDTFTPDAAIVVDLGNESRVCNRVRLDGGVNRNVTFNGGENADLMMLKMYLNGYYSSSPGQNASLTYNIPVLHDVEGSNVFFEVFLGNATYASSVIFNAGVCNGQDSGVVTAKTDKSTGNPGPLARVEFNADSDFADALSQGVKNNGRQIIYASSANALGDGRFDYYNNLSDGELVLGGDVTMKAGFRVGLSGGTATDTYMAIRPEDGSTDRVLTYSVQAGDTVVLQDSDGDERLILAQPTSGSAKLTYKIADLDGTTSETLTMYGGVTIEAGNTLMIKDVTVRLEDDLLGSGTVVIDGSNDVTTLKKHVAGTTLSADSTLVLRGANSVLDLATAGNETVALLTGDGGTVEMGYTTTDTLTTAVSPGESVGTLNFTGYGTLVLAGTSTFELGALAGPNDLVNLVAADTVVNVTLGGTLTIEDLGGLEVGDYTLFDLVGSAVISGSFSTLNLPTGVTATVETGSGDVVLHVTEVPSAAVPGDTDLDGDVDLDDLSTLAGNWNTMTGMTWADGDFDADGDVDLDDLSSLAGNWGYGTEGTGAVPEPATMSLLAIGGAALLRRKRR